MCPKYTWFDMPEPFCCRLSLFRVFAKTKKTVSASPGLPYHFCRRTINWWPSHVLNNMLISVVCVILKNEIRKKYETEQLPKFLGMLEKLLVSNKGGDGYFVGDKVIQQKLVIVAYLCHCDMTLTVPHSRTRTYADRCFPKAVALLWNNLPQGHRQYYRISAMPLKIVSF